VSGHTEADGPFTRARRRMVDEQLIARGIRDARVLATMAQVPRHTFVEGESAERSYGDHALASAQGQTISQPWIVARMLELATLAPDQCVLEIGTGTGYQTALLARLVRLVVSVERLGALVTSARARLDRLGVTNAVLVHGDGSLGWREHAPYARVLVAAAAPRVPGALLEQIEDGGSLVIPVGGALNQHLEVWRRRGERWTSERHGECRFVPLIGADAWRSDSSA